MRPIGEAVDAPFENGKYGKVFVSHIDLNDDVVEGLRARGHPGVLRAVSPGGRRRPARCAHTCSIVSCDLMRSAKEGTH